MQRALRERDTERGGAIDPLHQGRGLPGLQVGGEGGRGGRGRADAGPLEVGRRGFRPQHGRGRGEGRKRRALQKWPQKEEEEEEEGQTAAPLEEVAAGRGGERGRVAAAVLAASRKAEGGGDAMRLRQRRQRREFPRALQGGQVQSQRTHSEEEAMAEPRTPKIHRK